MATRCFRHSGIKLWKDNSNVIAIWLFNNRDEETLNQSHGTNVKHSSNLKSCLKFKFLIPSIVSFVVLSIRKSGIINVLIRKINYWSITWVKMGCEKRVIGISASRDNSENRRENLRKSTTDVIGNLMCICVYRSREIFVREHIGVTIDRKIRLVIRNLSFKVSSWWSKNTYHTLSLLLII